MCFSVVKRRFTKRCEKKDVPAGRNRLRMILASQDGMGVVEVILIIVGILTPYYRVGIRCIEWKYVDK